MIRRQLQSTWASCRLHQSPRSWMVGGRGDESSASSSNTNAGRGHPLLIRKPHGARLAANRRFRPIWTATLAAVAICNFQSARFSCDATGVDLATSTGDTLAGIVTGLLARGTTPLNAALWGVYLHGEAGLARAYAPISFLARELLFEIPRIMGEFINRADYDRAKSQAGCSGQGASQAPPSNVAGGCRCGSRSRGRNRRHC